MRLLHVLMAVAVFVTGCGSTPEEKCLGLEVGKDVEELEMAPRSPPAFSCCRSCPKEMKVEECGVNCGGPRAADGSCPEEFPYEAEIMSLGGDYAGPTEYGRVECTAYVRNGKIVGAVAVPYR